MYTIKSLRVSKAINPYVEWKWLLQCASMSTDRPTRWEKLEVILVTWNGLFTIIPPKKVGPSSGAAMFRVSRARRLSHTLAETRTTLLTEMRWHLPSSSRWLILLMRTERSSGFWTPVRPWPWKAIVFFVFRDFECTWTKVKKNKKNLCLRWQFYLHTNSFSLSKTAFRLEVLFPQTLTRKPLWYFSHLCFRKRH